MPLASANPTLGLTSRPPVSPGPHPVLVPGNTVTDCAVEQKCRQACSPPCHAGRETEAREEGSWLCQRVISQRINAGRQAFTLQPRELAFPGVLRLGQGVSEPPLTTSCPAWLHQQAAVTPFLEGRAAAHCAPKASPRASSTGEGTELGWGWGSLPKGPLASGRPSRPGSSSFLIRAQAGPQCCPQAQVAPGFAQGHQAFEAHSSWLVPVSAKWGILLALAGNYYSAANIRIGFLNPK